MKLKNTILLLVLAVGLFAFIKFYETGQLSSREAQERAGKVVSFDRDKVELITIKNSASKIVMRKDRKGIWRLEEPVKDRADSMAVSQLFTTAESLRSDAVIGDEKKGADKDQLKEYGLSNAETLVRFDGKEKPVGLRFGKDAAVEGKVYVRLENSNTAYVIGKELKEQISKKADEFRDRKLTDVNTTQVNRVSIKTSAGEIELEKKEQHWTLVKPLKARGADSKIGDLVSLAATAHVESFVSDVTNVSSFGLQEPRARVSLWNENDKQPTVIEVGANPKDDKEKSYARVSTREGVVLVPKSIEAFIATKPNDLRDKSLVRVEADIVDRLVIEGAGKEKIVLARSGEGWVRKANGKDEAINGAAAKKLLDEVRAQDVTAFVSDVASELSKYGLDQPRLKLTFSSYASENTAETKAGEKPIVAILFGKTEDGSVYAQVEDEPFIVALPETLLDVMMSDPLEWQPLEIFNEKAEDIAAIEVTREGQPLVALERDKDKTWKLAKGDGSVNQINAQSLVNTLAKLRAVRWVGAAKPEFGLERPALTVTFKTGNSSGKLEVGASTPEELAYASVSVRKGVFALSKPDLSAFQLVLLEKAPAAPAPATESPAKLVPPQP